MNKLYLAIKFRNGKTIMQQVPNHYYWSLPLRVWMLVGIIGFAVINFFLILIK